MKIVWLLVVLAGCGGSKPPASNAAPAAVASNPAPPADPASEPAASNAAPAAPGAAPAAPVGIATMRARLEQLADRMCTCKDAACARRVSDEMSRWGSEVTQANGGAVLNQADTDQLMPIIQRLAACMSDAMTRGSSSGSTP